MTHPVYGTVVKLRAVKFNGIVISKNESKKKKTAAGYICVSRFRHATWLIKNSGGIILQGSWPQ